MPALTETRDYDDDDGRAALYKDSGTEDVNEELGSDEDPIAEEDEDADPLAGDDEDEEENVEPDEE
jgi:hypothetical protein